MASGATPANLLQASVVVPTWNRCGLLIATLDSLNEQTLARELFEVVVVDDGSDDDTSIVVERYAIDHPELQLRCIRRPNGGVNAARNSGIEGTSAPAVAFLDDDELAPPDYLERALQHLELSQNVAGVGGPALETGSGFRTCSRCSIGEVTLPHVGIALSHLLLGGNMVLRRSALDKVGMFDAEISGRGDETEWFERAQLTFLYDESLFILHRKDSFTLRELCRIQFRQGQAIPVVHRKIPGSKRFRPSVTRMPRYLAHAVSRKCDKGFLLAARELGATLEWLRGELRRIAD